MGDDGFKPLDINALHRRAQTSEAREHTRRRDTGPTVMEQQRQREQAREMERTRAVQRAALLGFARGGAGVPSNPQTTIKQSTPL